MSEMSASPARPVSLFTIVFLFVVFAAFLLAVRYFYSPSTIAPQSASVENLPKELEWRATAESRRAALNEQRQVEAKQATTYAWIDQNAGVVQLPIERAMELVVQESAAKQQPREIRDLPAEPRRRL
jgi:hypothetical protein